MSCISLIINHLNSTENYNFQVLSEYHKDLIWILVNINRVSSAETQLKILIANFNLLAEICLLVSDYETVSDGIWGLCQIISKYNSFLFGKLAILNNEIPNYSIETECISINLIERLISHILALLIQNDFIILSKSSLEFLAISIPLTSPENSSLTPSNNIKDEVMKRIDFYYSLNKEENIVPLLSILCLTLTPSSLIQYFPFIFKCLDSEKKSVYPKCNEILIKMASMITKESFNSVMNSEIILSLLSLLDGNNVEFEENILNLLEIIFQTMAQLNILHSLHSLIPMNVSKFQQLENIQLSSNDRIYRIINRIILNYFPILENEI